MRSSRMRKCPAGFICSDTKIILLILFLALLILGGLWYWTKIVGSERGRERQVIVVQAPQTQQSQQTQQTQSQSLFPPEPVQRLTNMLPSLQTRRSGASSFQQVGILTGEGGSSSSASPDRTILPLYGRELDTRRGRWNYYTRTDGSNPVQVPVRIKNKLCDDDTNGCDEIYSDDSVNIPALGRSMAATVYRKSMFS